MKTNKKLITLLIIGCITLFSASTCYGAVIYVPGEYSTIQQGINAASSGDTIIVSTGIYEEEVTLQDNLTLTGLGQPTIGTVSTASLSAANNCAIEGFKVHSLEISGKNNVIVKNCVLLGKEAEPFNSATITAGSQDILIENCTFSDELFGDSGAVLSRIDVNGVSDLTFRNNVVLTKDTAANPADVIAISLTDVTGNSSLSNNVIIAESHNTDKGVGLNLATSTSLDLTIMNNIISATGLSLDGESTGATISYNDLPEGISHVGANVELGPNNFSADPVFTEGKGYYLKPTSPAVDAGIIEDSDQTEMGIHQKITYLKAGQSLQDAINNATPNEIIYLGPNDAINPYYPAEEYRIKSEDGTADVEPAPYGILVIAKDIHIVGSGQHNTFVKGPIQFIFSDGSLENLTVMSPNELDVDHIAEVDYDLDGRWDYDFTGSILIANGSPTIENVMLEPDFVVLEDPGETPTGIGIAIIENTSGSPTSPIIRNTVLKKFADAIKVEGNHDEIVLSPVVEHCVFVENTNGINCDTPYALLALRNTIFSDMTVAIDLAKTPYKNNIINNIQRNLFYNNTTDCLHNSVDITSEVFANNGNNQTGEPKYLKPADNVYATLFDSPGVAINAGLEYYVEIDESGNITYYESPLKGKMLAVVDFTGGSVLGTAYDSEISILKYDQSNGTYTGKTVQYFVSTMDELKFYEEYNVSGDVTRFYADGRSFPGGPAGTTSPTVQLVSPDPTVPDQILKGVVLIEWAASDPDFDSISIDLEYSTNGVDFYLLAEGIVNDTMYAWDSMAYPDSSNYKIRATAYKVKDATKYSQHETGTGNEFQVDNTLPAVSITYPPDNTGLSTTIITVEMDASDATLDMVEVKVSGDTGWQLANFITDHYEADVTLPIDGTRAIIVARATDLAGNISTDKVGVIKGYMRYIEMVKYYKREENSRNLSSIAVAQDLLHLMRSTDYGYTGMPLEDDLYNYGLARNFSGNQTSGSELDAKGLTAVLQRYDPYGSNSVGYNYSHNSTTNYNAYLKDMIHWLSWAIRLPGVTPRGIPEDYPEDYCRAPYMAALAPLSAYIEGYSRWAVINGCAASRSPLRYPDQPWRSSQTSETVTIYGLFMTDPQTRGIGQDMYIPYASLDDYLKPLTSSDPHTDKYVSVVEPPVPSNFDLEGQEPIINKSTLTLLNIAKFVNGEEVGDFSKHLVDGALVMELDESDAVKNFSTSADLETLFKPETADENNSSLNWKDIIPAARLIDEDFVAAVDGSEVRDFIKVHRNDTGEDYYIIPFDKSVKAQYLSQAALLMNAKTSAIIADSYVDEPTRYVQITEKEAIEQITKKYPSITANDIDVASLVYEDGGATSSSFYPYWELIVGETTYHVWEK